MGDLVARQASWAICEATDQHSPPTDRLANEMGEFGRDQTGWTTCEARDPDPSGLVWPPGAISPVAVFLSQAENRA